MIQLSKYITAIQHIIVANCASDNINICGICNDSRNVKNDFIFVAINGELDDGHKYIKQAIANYAKVIIYEDELTEFSENIQYIKVASAYQAYALCCEIFFDYPAKHLNCIGVTGTNGKTTIAYIIKQLLKHKAGLISTITYDNGKQAIPATRTTPEPFSLQKSFNEIKNNNCEFVIMEVSSHSLIQNRIGSTKFQVAVWTNLTGEHLDYHKTINNYFLAKKKLFTEHLSKNGFAIINTDDKYGKILYNEIGGKSLGTNINNDFYIEIIEESMWNTTFKLTIDKVQTLTITTNLIGRFNIYNLASAIATCAVIDDINNYTFQYKKIIINIPGRLNSIKIKNSIFFVDYAHTDDALNNVLQTLAQLAKTKIITVFGCGGDRDKTKRPRMGKVAQKYSDIIILTNDNPRTENPNEIIEDIKQGIYNLRNVFIILDRKKAIQKSIKLAQKNDIILIAGKGHENYQIIDNNNIYFNDMDILKSN